MRDIREGIGIEKGDELGATTRETLHIYKMQILIAVIGTRN